MNPLQNNLKVNGNASSRKNKCYNYLSLFPHSSYPFSYPFFWINGDITHSLNNLIDMVQRKKKPYWYIYIYIRTHPCSQKI